MSQVSQSLAALVGARICHDLISPIGAISNGMELLAMDGASTTPEMALVAESVTHANARVRFFRIAFGTPDSAQVIPAAEIRKILAELGRDARHSARWPVTDGVSRAEARRAFLGMLCLESAMPRGGRIDILDAEGRLHLSTDGEVEKHGEIFERLAAGHDPGVDSPALVHFALLAARADAPGHPPRLSRGAGGATLSL